MAIAAAANPITILRMTMLTPCQETHPSLTLQTRQFAPSCRCGTVARLFRLRNPTKLEADARSTSLSCLPGNAIGRSAAGVLVNPRSDASAAAFTFTEKRS
jgi:hypothetical protein